MSDKDPKTEPHGGSDPSAKRPLPSTTPRPSSVPTRPLGSGRPLAPSSRPPPRASIRPPATSSRPPAAGDRFPGLTPKHGALDASTNPDPVRKKQVSVEEISSSLLLEDASDPALQPAPLEELSGSLLLEDPADHAALRIPVRASSQRPVAGAGASAALAGGLSPSFSSPPARSTAPPGRSSGPPAAHRTLLGMPELQTSAPGPNLDRSPSSPRVFASATTTLRPAPPPDTEPSGFGGGAPSADVPSADVPSADATEPTRALDEAALATVPMPTLLMAAETVPEPAADAPAGPASHGTGGASTAPVEGDVEVTALPRSALVVAGETLQRSWERLRSGRLGRDGADGPRAAWFLPAVAVGGLAIGIGVVALIVSFARGGSRTTDAPNDTPSVPGLDIAATSPAIPTGAEATAGAVAAVGPGTLVASTAHASLAAAPEPAPVIETTACKVTGAPRVVAPSAIVSAGIEVRALGDGIGLGFAPNDHDAVAVRLDPSTMTPSTTIDAPSTDPVRRVVPFIAPNGKLSLSADVDHDGDALQGRRTLALDPPVQIGASDGHLTWARVGGAGGGALWPLEGSGDVEALRGAADLGATAGSTADGVGTVVALRRANAIWIGAASGHDPLAPQGALSKIAGFGTAVGSPAIAVNDGIVLVAWADRAATTDPWRLRWVRFKAGEAPGEPGTFTPPAGGKGEQAMSPGLAAVPGGRFLLVWTEGPASRHDVRAITLSHDGEPLGAPLDISRTKVNAGQGQVAVSMARRGLVAFLESSDGGFEVAATPIRCD